MDIIIATNTVITLTLLTLMGVSAVLVIRLRSLMSVILVTSIFTLLAAGVYITMDSVDVAFTEAAVGAGISTFLGLATLAVLKYTPKTKANEDHLKDSIGPLFVCILVGIFLILGAWDMPAYGDPNAPVHQHVANYYLAVSYKEFGIPNVVTSVLGGYRSIDTFGETIVVFTAAIGVLALIGAASRDIKKADYKTIEDDDSDLDAFAESAEEVERILQYIQKESKNMTAKRFFKGGSR